MYVVLFGVLLLVLFFLIVYHVYVVRRVESMVDYIQDAGLDRLRKDSLVSVSRSVEYIRESEGYGYIVLSGYYGGRMYRCSCSSDDLARWMGYSRGCYADVEYVCPSGRLLEMFGLWRSRKILLQV